MQKIIVLDYGSQYNQLITRRIREFGVFSELKSHKMTLDEIKAYNPKAIIISGGPNSVYEDDAFDIDPGVFGHLLWHAAHDSKTRGKSRS